MSLPFVTRTLICLIMTPPSRYRILKDSAYASVAITGSALTSVPVQAPPGRSVVPRGWMQSLGWIVHRRGCFYRRLWSESDRTDRVVLVNGDARRTDRRSEFPWNRRIDCPNSVNTRGMARRYRAATAGLDFRLVGPFLNARQRDDAEPIELKSLGTPWGWASGRVLADVDGGHQSASPHQSGDQ